LTLDFLRTEIDRKIAPRPQCRLATPITLYLRHRAQAAVGVSVTMAPGIAPWRA
jgi:hypothetical protein